MAASIAFLEEWMDSLVKAVRALRQHLGESQQAFATRLGLSIRAIANYEKDRRPTGMALLALARAATAAGKQSLTNDFMRALMEELRLTELPFVWMELKHRDAEVYGLMLANVKGRERVEYVVAFWDCLQELDSENLEKQARAAERLGALKAAVDGDPERQLPSWAKKQW